MESCNYRFIGDNIDLFEIWGDGSEFGMSPEIPGFIQKLHRELACTFAAKVYDKIRSEVYVEGYIDGYGHAENGISALYG